MMEICARKIECRLPYLEKFDLFAHRAVTEGDADRVGGLRLNRHIGGFADDMVACPANGFNAVVGVFHLQGYMADSTLAGGIVSVGENLNKPGAGVQHDGGGFAVTPAPGNGKSQQFVIKRDGLLEFFQTLGL